MHAHVVSICYCDIVHKSGTRWRPAKRLAGRTRVYMLHVARQFISPKSTSSYCTSTALAALLSITPPRAALHYQPVAMAISATMGGNYIVRNARPEHS